MSAQCVCVCDKHDCILVKPSAGGKSAPAVLTHLMQIKCMLAQWWLSEHVCHSRWRPSTHARTHTHCCSLGIWPAPQQKCWNSVRVGNVSADNTGSAWPLHIPGAKQDAKQEAQLRCHWKAHVSSVGRPTCSPSEQSYFPFSLTSSDEHKRFRKRSVKRFKRA